MTKAALKVAMKAGCSAGSSVELMDDSMVVPSVIYLADRMVAMKAVLKVAMRVDYLAAMKAE